MIIDHDKKLNSNCVSLTIFTVHSLANKDIQKIHIRTYIVLNFVLRHIYIISFFLQLEIY